MINKSSLPLSGVATIRIKERVEGEWRTVHTREESNIILNKAYQRMIVDAGAFYDSTSTSRIRIYISQDNQTPQTSIESLSQGYATGDDTSVALKYERVIGEIGNELDPTYCTYTQQFAPPPTTRTINSVGLAVDAFSDFGDSPTRPINNPYTYLLLNSSLIQNSSQLLEITYRVSINWTDVDVSQEPDWRIAIKVNSIFTQGEISSYRPALRAYRISSCNPDSGRGFIYPYIRTNNFDLDIALGLDLDNLSSITETTTNQTVSGLSIRGLLVSGIGINSIPMDTYNGSQSSSLNVVKKYNQIKDGVSLHEKFAPLSKTSNLSGITSHSTNSSSFLYDTLNLANSSWQPTVDEGVESDFPALYSLKVTTSGGLGIGEYKIYKAGMNSYHEGSYDAEISNRPAPFYGYSSNSVRDYMQRSVHPSNLSLPAVFEFDTFMSKNLLIWSESLGDIEFISWNKRVGLGLFNLTDNSFSMQQVWRLSAFPVLGSIIYDIDIIPSSDLVYIATDTGLHTLNVVSGVVTTLNSDTCLATCLGNGDEVFAVFTDGVGGGRISSTIGTDWNTALNIGTPPIPIFWDNVWRIFMDKDSLDYNMMLIDSPNNTKYATTLESNTILFHRRWWNNTSGVVSTEDVSFFSTSSHLSNSDIYFPGKNIVSAENGVWVYAETYYRGFPNYSNRVGYDIDLIEDLELAGHYGFRTYHGIFNTNVTSFAVDRPTADLGSNLASPIVHIPAVSMISVSDFAKLNWSGTNKCTGLGSTGFIKPKLASEGTSFEVVFATSRSETYNDAPQDRHGSLVEELTANLINNPTNLSGTWATTNSTKVIAYFLKATIDTNTNTVVFNGYTDPANGYRYSVYSTFAYLHGNPIVLKDKRILLSPSDSTIFSRGFSMLANYRNPSSDLNDVFLQSWSWDGTNWVEDPLNDGPGKPLHTTNDSLIDGMSISWADLQPGNSQDLVADQYYHFSKTTTDGMVFIEDHFPDISLSYYESIRPRPLGSTALVTDVNVSQYVAEAPLGSSPNPEWYSFGLLDLNPYLEAATLDGIEINLIRTTSTSIGAAGTVKVNINTGQLIFNAADDGKSFVYNDYRYVQRLDSNELPLT